MGRAALADSDYTVEMRDDGAWDVLKPDGSGYVVSIRKIRFGCTCDGFKYRGACRHVVLVQKLTGVSTKSRKDPQPMWLMQELAELARNRLRGFGMSPTVAGSIRRGVKPVAGDIDIVLVTSRLGDLADTGWQRISGGENSATYLYRGVQVNVKATTAEAFGAALLHYTGSRDFNIMCRARAKASGWTLNEFGLWEGDGKVIARQTEEAILNALRLDEYIEPGSRER